MSDCNNEIEYSNVGYFDKQVKCMSAKILHVTVFHHFWFFSQTVGDDKVEDPNEWLSIDIGDLAEVC